MTRRLRPLWLVLPALALVAAGPASVPPNELVRQANDALGRKQYIDALKLYDRAEERVTDPGLVAFNEGVAHYQKGNYAEAEVHFRLARQDATGRRQVFAAYNLAASIVQLPGDADPAKLAEAIRLFEDCLRHEEIDEHLAADSRHNLELAKMLWVQAKARPNPPKQNPPDDPEEDPKQQPPRPEPVPQPGQGDGSASPKNGNIDRTPGTADQGPEPIKTDGQQAPGASNNLPVIPDRDELAPMSREEAEAHLRQAIDKVMKEGRTHRQRSQKAPSGKVRDW
jgi:tetratricopeptide (TPR) repeat protein